MERYVGIIPARYGSSRFPGKPLAQLRGRPMIWHVYNSSLKFDRWKSLYVATDDERILNVCDDLHIPCMLTSKSHQDCIDRAAEVAERLEASGQGAERYIVIQGDEPCFNASVLHADFSPSVVNYYTKIVVPDEIDDPNVVKVVVSKSLRAIYFSRHTIPFSQSKTRKTSDPLSVDKQIGIYAFSIEALRQYKALGVSYLEGLEGIGLLRFIENDIDVHMRYSDYDSISVDTEEDLAYVSSIMEQKDE